MDPSKLVVGGVEYPADALRNTAGKRYAITSLKENIPPPHLTMCTRFTSGYGVGCTGANEFDCPYIHLDSNTPIEAGAQTALATATTTTEIVLPSAMSYTSIHAFSLPQTPTMK